MGLLPLFLLLFFGAARSDPPPSCAVCRRPAEAPLRGTSWRLTALGDAPVQASGLKEPPYLLFSKDDLRVSGSGGCNRLAGSFALQGEKLHFGPIASTRMACPVGMEQEERFLSALSRVESYRIRGNRLDLLGRDGEALLRFEAPFHF